MANQTWTNHSQAICMDVNLWYDHDKFWGGKNFWFKCSMWMRSLQAILKCLNCLNWTFQTKVMANRTWDKPFAMMLIYDTITTNFDEENTFDFSVPCEWGHSKLWKNAWIVSIGPSKPRLWLIELEQITGKLFACMLICDTITTKLDEENIFYI